MTAKWPVHQFWWLFLGLRTSGPSDLTLDHDIRFRNAPNVTSHRIAEFPRRQCRAAGLLLAASILHGPIHAFFTQDDHQSGLKLGACYYWRGRMFKEHMCWISRLCLDWVILQPLVIWVEEGASGIPESVTEASHAGSWI